MKTPSRRRRGRIQGGCACGGVRYTLRQPPLFVHCCHCRRCQRATGGPFAHNAIIEASAMSLDAGEVLHYRVSTDSGRAHWIARCTLCSTALWNEHGSRSALLRYVRVGSMDRPSDFPPLAHIYVASKQAWISINAATPVFRGHYSYAKLWPHESVARYQALKSMRRSK